MVSPVHWEEIAAIPDIFERVDIEERLHVLSSSINVDLLRTKKKAEELHRLKFGIADAGHVAFAEQCGAEFISYDVALIKKYLKCGIRIWCGNPVAFCEKENIR